MATLIRGDGRTVNAYQDSILGDFAFGGKDGIVKNVGQECGLDTETLNTAKVKSGMVVIQGRQITLDGTDTITLPVPTGSTVYWTTLYLELDMSATTDDGFTGKVTLKKLEYTASYPAVPTSDNLKVQTAGKAYLGLYRFKNTANGITESSAIAETIDSGDLSNQVQTEIDDINARLESLGFKQGSAALQTGTSTGGNSYRYTFTTGQSPLIFTNTINFEIRKNALKRQGNYVFWDLEIYIDDIEVSTSSGVIGRTGNADWLRFTIPSNFLPKATEVRDLGFSGVVEIFSSSSGTSEETVDRNAMTCATDGSVAFETATIKRGRFAAFTGWEAKPL